MRSRFIHWPMMGLGVLVLGLLSACNLAGQLPEGPVTPIVPLPGPTATRPATPSAAPPAGTTPTAVRPTAAVVGTLANGTAGASAPNRMPLTLYALDSEASTIMFTRTVTSDVGGRFVLDQLDPSPTIIYAVHVPYQKADYYSDLVTFAHGDLTVTMPITVYETTVDASAVQIEQMHLFFEFTPGRVVAGQLFIVTNSGDRAYLGAEGTSVRFSLPPNATNVSFEDGAPGGRFQLVAGGFADTEAVTPGVGAAEILVSFELPYDGKKLDLDLTAAYPIRNVNVLVPEGGVMLTSGQLAATGSRDTQNGKMLHFVGGGLAAGQAFALQLSGAPSLEPAGQASTGIGGVSPLLVASAILLLAAAGIVAFVWLRQERATAEPEAEQVDLDAQREEMLDAMAALDDDFEAGQIPEADYRRQRQELKAELVELMGG